jgi:alkylation response protein AidB-like acyl-CoA dehydrogenase
VAVMLAAQELGQALAGGGWLCSTVMAGQLLSQLATPAQQQAWLPAMAEGRLQATVALYEPGARYEWHHVDTRAQADGNSHILSGRKTLVLQGDSAGLLLVVARTHGASDAAHGLSVFAVDPGMPGVQIQGFDTLDGGRAAHVVLHEVRLEATRLLGPADQAFEALEATLDAANAALCAEAVGAVEALIAHTADHLRTRQQFGSPLARFQVLQHRLADMAIGLEQLKSMACAAAAALTDSDAAQRRRVVSAAKALVSQHGRQIGLSAIQLHGGMGMTDECRVGHYTKRLMVMGQLFGDAAWHMKRMASG